MIIPYIPWIMAHPPVIPKLYYGAISQEQRICQIAKTICGMEAYLKYLSETIVDLPATIRAEVKAMIAEVEEDLNDAMSDLNDDLQNQMEELRQWVRDQTFSVQTWDVTRGQADNSVESMRRIFFDVTTDGTTVDRLANSTMYKTVDELAQSGWNCRALAVIGATVLNETDTQQWHVA